MDCSTKEAGGVNWKKKASTGGIIKELDPEN